MARRCEDGKEGSGSGTRLHLLTNFDETLHVYLLNLMYQNLT